MSLRHLCLALSLAAAPIGLSAQAPLANPTASVSNPFGIPDPDAMLPFIRLPDADIDTFISTLELYTNRIVQRPGTIQLPANASFNLVIPNPIAKRDVVRAMETVLQLNGVSVIYQDDKFLKVVANSVAVREAPTIIEGSTLDLPPSGRISSKIFVLEFAGNVTGIQGQIASMLNGNTPGGVAFGQNVIALASSNTLMITDTLTNLQRVEAFLNIIDRPLGEGSETRFYQLKNARATDMVTRINNSFNASQRAALQATSSITADDRTNQVVVVANPRQLPILERLITSLDISAAPNTAIKVIPIMHAEATTLAGIITTMISGSNAAAQRLNPNAPTTGRGGQAGAAQPGAGQVVPAAPGGAGPAGAPGAAVPAAPAAQIAAAPAQAGNTAVAPSNDFSTGVTVNADERSNSITVSGTANDIILVEKVIQGLDVALDQVAIEVIIAEVSLTDNDISGISALNLAIGTDTPLGTVTRNPADGTAVTVGSADGGRGTHITNFAGSIGGMVLTGGQVNPFAVAAALGDAGRKGKVNIVQSNTIVTMHNQPATFAVTTQEPIANQTTDANGNVTVTPTFEEVGISMNVTPRIGKDGSIQLQIAQTVDDIIEYVPIGGNNTPRIGSRQAESNVYIRDQEMIVLGGLQSNKRSNTRNKIGFFWEIPVLSHIFGGRTRTDTRTELLFFIRPRIIRPGEGTAVTNQKIDELMNKDDIKQFLTDPSKKIEGDLLDYVR